MKRCARTGLVRRSLIIAALPTTRTRLGVTAVAVHFRIAWPARHSSPKQSPDPKIPTTVSRCPDAESCTTPFRTYRRLSATSPCEKITSRAWQSLIVRFRPAKARYLATLIVWPNAMPQRPQYALRDAAHGLNHLRANS